VVPLGRRWSGCGRRSAARRAGGAGSSSRPNAARSRASRPGRWRPSSRGLVGFLLDLELALEDEDLLFCSSMRWISSSSVAGPRGGQGRRVAAARAAVRQRRAGSVMGRAPDGRVLEQPMLGRRGDQVSRGWVTNRSPLRTRVPTSPYVASTCDARHISASLRRKSGWRLEVESPGTHSRWSLCSNNDNMKHLSSSNSFHFHDCIYKLKL